MKDPLFESIRINTLKIKNRINMPAMHLNMARNYEVTDQLVDFYAERARGGAGMITVGYATVDDLSGGPKNIGAHDDTFLPGLTRLAAAITENGARAAVQLNHGGRQMPSMFLGGKKPVAPSALPCKLTRETPRALEREEIQQIVKHFARAARRVKQAGFDAVEVLCAAGYLLSSFLSPLTNQRDDEYGGSTENRMRFGVDLIEAVRNAVGTDFPVIVRMNGNDLMPGGLGRLGMLDFAKTLAKNGCVDALHINIGWHEARVPQITSSVPRAAYAYLARGIREQVNIPVIAAHRINVPSLARDLIADGMCDLVAIGRGLIADPYFPEKAREGREDEIIHCIACAQGCFDHIFKGKPVECLCNPRAGHETENCLEQAARPKRVMVVGGGPAGMSAAAAAADRGHNVTLYEKTGRLGGQLHLAAAPPGREEFTELATDLEKQLAIRGIPVVFEQTVDENLIEKEKPDCVVLATGATPMEPAIPGMEHVHVVQAWDVLGGKTLTGRRVAIIGGGAVGVETALLLADRGTLSGDAVKFLMANTVETPEYLVEISTRGTKEIILIEMIDTIGKDIGKSTRWAMLQELDRRGVKTKVATTALRITENGLTVEHMGKSKEIPADTVVIAAGSNSYNPLQDVLERKGIPFQVVGDAGQVAKAFEAVHQGFAAGKTI